MCHQLLVIGTGRQVPYRKGLAAGALRTPHVALPNFYMVGGERTPNEKFHVHRGAESVYHDVGKQRPLGTKMPKRAPKLKKGFLPRTGAGIEIETVNPKVKDRTT